MFLTRLGQLRIRDRLAAKYCEVTYVGQCENIGLAFWQLEEAEIGCLNIVEHKRGPRIFPGAFDFDSTHFQPIHMTNEETLGRSGSKHVRLRIVLLFFGKTQCAIGRSSTTLMQNRYVADTNIFDHMAGNTRQNRAYFLWERSRAHDVADVYSPQYSDGHACRSAHARSQTDEDRRFFDIAHSEIGNRDVFDDPAIHGLNRQAAASIENAIRNRNVLEAAIGLGTKFDSSGARYRYVGRKALVARVEDRAFFETAGHDAVCDRNHFGGARIPQRVGTLEANAIVPGRVHRAVGDVNVAAAIDVHPIAVGVDGEIVDGEVVDAGGEDSEVPAVKDGKIAQQDVAAVLQRNGLVAHSCLLGDGTGTSATAQAFAPDQAAADDCNVFKPLSPDQAIVPMIVAKVLVALPRRV